MTDSRPTWDTGETPDQSVLTVRSDLGLIQILQLPDGGFRLLGEDLVGFVLSQEAVQAVVNFLSGDLVQKAKALCTAWLEGKAGARLEVGFISLYRAAFGRYPGQAAAAVQSLRRPLEISDGRVRFRLEIIGGGVTGEIFRFEDEASIKFQWEPPQFARIVVWLGSQLADAPCQACGQSGRHLEGCPNQRRIQL
jgi:hypothetical protein